MENEWFSSFGDGAVDQINGVLPRSEDAGYLAGAGANLPSLDDLEPLV